MYHLSMDHKAEQIGRIQGSLLIHCSTAYTSITEVIKHFPCLHHPFSMPLKTYNDVSTKRRYITMETGMVTSIAMNAIKIIGIYVMLQNIIMVSLIE